MQNSVTFEIGLRCLVREAVRLRDCAHRYSVVDIEADSLRGLEVEVDGSGLDAEPASFALFDIDVTLPRAGPLMLTSILTT